MQFGKSNAEKDEQRSNARLEKASKKQVEASLSVDEKSDEKSVPKEAAGQSASLNSFRETIKDVLEEITSLEINTMIVGNIPMSKFDVQEFYMDISDKIAYKTEQGLQNVKESLLERSAQLKPKGASLPQQTSTSLLPKEAAAIEQYRAELTSYNQDLEAYKAAEQIFNDRRNSLDPLAKEQFEREHACYSEISRQLAKLKIPKDASGKIISDAPMIRYFRKLWEFEQSVLNGERIFAQTKFHLDGDLTNKFIDDLFMPSKSRIDPTMTQLVFDLHRQGVENAQKQWSGLITTCVNLVKSLMPFRAQ